MHDAGGIAPAPMMQMMQMMMLMQQPAAQSRGADTSIGMKVFERLVDKGPGRDQGPQPRPAPAALQDKPPDPAAASAPLALEDGPPPLPASAADGLSVATLKGRDHIGSGVDR